MPSASDKSRSSESEPDKDYASASIIAISLLFKKAFELAAKSVVKAINKRMDNKFFLVVSILINIYFHCMAL